MMSWVKSMLCAGAAAASIKSRAYAHFLLEGLR
jgi:hypothetical protein